MAIQKTKERINVGNIGDPTTGDILYDGGIKLNNTIDNLYNAFADYRLFVTDDGVGKMTLHPIGYYQKMTSAYYTSNPIELGSLHDVTTKDGSQTVNLPAGKAGEGVCIINTDGSFSSLNPVVIRPSTNQEIIGTAGSLNVTIPNSKITLFCVTGGSRAVWRYKIESLFGDESIPVEKSINHLANQEVTTPLLSRTDYDVIKFIVIGETATSKFKTAELMLYVSHAGDLHWNEYSVIKSDGDDIVEIKFDLDGNTINLVSKSTSEALTLTIKAIDTINKGIA